MSTLILRPAREEDLEAITAIYNDAVLHTTATFDTEPLSLENRRAWLKDRTSDFPVVVAEEDGNVAAYIALNRWSDRPAYDVTAELSLYVAPSCKGRAIGTVLTDHLLERAQSTGLYTLLLRITADNAASLRLAEKFGFERIGTFRHCGIKFGRVLDVVFFQKVLK